MKRAAILISLLIAGATASAQLLTRQEIDSALGSKQSYSRAEVIDLVYNMQTAFFEELALLENRLVKENETRYQAERAAYIAGIGQARAELTGIWIVDAILGASLVVYGLVKADIAIVATGGLMVGGGIGRLIIAIK